jgi:hypothetical protein
MRILCLAILASLFLPAPLMADTVYTYTGNDFTYIIAGTAFTTSDFVSGSFTVASPLAGNQPIQALTSSVLSFSFTDGLSTIDNPQTLWSVPIFDVATDASGNITGWDIDLMSSNNGDFQSEILTRNLGGVGDLGRTAYNADLADNLYAPGTWTQSTPAGAAPEPGSLLLLATGLIGLAAFLHRSAPHRIGRT